MSSDDAATPRRAGTPAIPLELAADLQDHLMTATNDLDRLHALLSDACDTLQAGFLGACSQLSDARGQPGAQNDLVEQAAAQLGTAVRALQFQDLASQLIHHTRARLRSCADRLAQDAFAGDEDGETAVEQAPLRPNPVHQSEMGEGLIELF